MTTPSTPITPQSLHTLQPGTVRRFLVTVIRPDGTGRTYTREGGSLCDHVSEGLAEAGAGGAVRVLPIPLLQAAA